MDNLEVQPARCSYGLNKRLVWESFELVGVNLMAIVIGVVVLPSCFALVTIIQGILIAKITHMSKIIQNSAISYDLNHGGGRPLL